jgi:hypothetical protein
MPQIITKDGTAQEIFLNLDQYKAALDSDMSFAAYLNNTYGADVDSEKNGTPYEQLLLSSGMFMNENRSMGIKPPTVRQILGIDGSGSGMQAGAIIRPDGSQALTISGRLLFASTVLELVDHALHQDTAAYTGNFNKMVATTQTLTSPRIDQPIINRTAPRGSRSQAVAQMANPVDMVSISLSEKSFRMPTYAISLEISHEAETATTLDLVSIILKQQAEGQRAAIIDEAIKKLVLGDVDWGLSALSGNLITAYDSSISTANTITHKAWLRWLREDRQYKTITHVIGDLDAFMAIEGRSGRPVVTGDKGTDARLNVEATLMDKGLPGGIQFFDTQTSLLGAGVVVGLDSSYAIKKWIYTGATYSAIEEYVMRRSRALRVDFSEAYTRIFDDGFKRVALATS